MPLHKGEYLVVFILGDNADPPELWIEESIEEAELGIEARLEDGDITTDTKAEIYDYNLAPVSNQKTIDGLIVDRIEELEEEALRRTVPNDDTLANTYAVQESHDGDVPEELRGTHMDPRIYEPVEGEDDDDIELVEEDVSVPTHHRQPKEVKVPQENKEFDGLFPE